MRNDIAQDARNVALLLSMVAAAASPGAADAQETAGAPLRISRPGAYVLHRDIGVDEGAAVEIVASDVTLDLNGHTLAGPGNKQGVGIRVQGVSGVRVHGGTLARFGVGVEVRDAENVRVDGLQIRGEDQGGPPPGEVGVLIFNSRGVVVANNQITGAFLGIFVRGGGSGGNRIALNTLTGGANGQLGICYNPDGLGTPAGPSGDLVYNNLISHFAVGIQTSDATAANLFRENDIAFRQLAIDERTPGSNLFGDNASIALP